MVLSSLCPVQGNGWGGEQGGARGQWGPQGGFQEALRLVRAIGKPHSRPLERRVGVPVPSGGRQSSFGMGGGAQRPGGRGGCGGPGGKRSDPMAYKKVRLSTSLPTGGHPFSAVTIVGNHCP